MITAFVFFGHFIFALLIFTKKWQDEGISSGFLNVSLIAILFTVGWTIAGMMAKVFMEAKGFGLHFDRDTFALTMLSIAEYFFYRLYYRNESSSDGTEKR